MSFSYCNTVKVFCCEKEDGLKDYLIQNNFKKILVVTGQKKSLSIAKDIVSSLSEFEWLLCEGVEPNPIVSKIEEIVNEARNFDPDVVLTVGGGSVHDTGKTVAILLCQEGEVDDFTVTGKLSVPGIKRTKPIITVSTVCGSGAEVSPAALIRIKNEKKVIFSPLLHPNAAFLITKYVEDIPTDILRRSVFDAFVQAFEGYVSLNANAISDSFALSVISGFFENYSDLCKDTINVGLIEKTFVMSVLSSYVCSTASVGAIHAVSDTISGHFNVHHATALAMVISGVLNKNLKYVDEKRLAEIYRLCKKEVKCPKELIEYIKEIISEMNLLNDIEKTNISNDEFGMMVEESFNGDMVGNPVEFSKEDVSNILGEWYGIR